MLDAIVEDGLVEVVMSVYWDASGTAAKFVDAGYHLPRSTSASVYS